MSDKEARGSLVYFLGNYHQNARFYGVRACGGMFVDDLSPTSHQGQIIIKHFILDSLK